MAKNIEKPQADRSDPKGRIVKAARKLFFEHGVGKVTMDMLVAEAKTSKMTLYKYFPDKKDIFEAFLFEECKRLYDPNTPLPETENDFREQLVTFGVNLLKLISDPDILRFDQLILSQATKHPDLTEVFYENSYEASCNDLQKLIIHGQKNGWVASQEDPELIAFTLVMAWEGKTYQKALYGLVEPKFTNKPKRVKRCLNLVLDMQFEI